MVNNDSKNYLHWDVRTRYERNHMSSYGREVYEYQEKVIENIHNLHVESILSLGNKLKLLTTCTTEDSCKLQRSFNKKHLLCSGCSNKETLKENE